jgi:hypothetical protein
VVVTVSEYTDLLELRICSVLTQLYLWRLAIDVEISRDILPVVAPGSTEILSGVARLSSHPNSVREVRIGVERVL